MRKPSMTEIHVSFDGQGDGSAASPCSLAAARELVRGIDQEMSGDINVYLGGGVYRLDSPFALSPKDSGTNGFKVRWRNKPGTRPVFSSAETITDWSLHDAKRNIWKASVPAGMTFEHLWVNGRRMHRAWSGWNPEGFSNTERGIRYEGEAESIPKWENPTDVVITKKFMWRHIPCFVERINEGELVLDPECVTTYKVPQNVLGVTNTDTLEFLNGDAIARADFAIENAYELLTDEGEWYLDKPSSTLYYRPLDSAHFTSDSQADYASLETFILLDGSLQDPVKNIAIEGLTFECSRGTKMGITAGSPTEPTNCVTPRPQNALQVNAGQSITVKDCTFLHMGSGAIHFDLMGTDLRIIGNAFGDVSRAAISLNQSNLVVSEANKAGIQPENADKFFDGVEISNNYIRYTGIDDIGAAVVYSEFTRNLEFSHNEITEVPTIAVRNGWRFLAWEGHTENIEYAWNKTAKVGQADMADYSALYIACSSEGGSSMHHNYINGVGASNANVALYLDVYADKVKVL
jgi:hypothetical protein